MAESPDKAVEVVLIGNISGDLEMRLLAAQPDLRSQDIPLLVSKARAEPLMSYLRTKGIEFEPFHEQVMGAVRAKMALSKLGEVPEELCRGYIVYPDSGQ